MRVKKHVTWDLPQDLSDEENEHCQDLDALLGSGSVAANWAPDDPVLLYLKQRYGSIRGQQEEEGLVDSADELEAEAFYLEACHVACYPYLFT
ncbi:hypothetical protein SK128_005290, partial [Halocaridina rubra]